MDMHSLLGFNHQQPMMDGDSINGSFIESMGAMYRRDSNINSAYDQNEFYADGSQYDGSAFKGSDLNESF
jgi:hypothetical protein